MSFKQYFSKSRLFLYTEITDEINDEQLMQHVLTLNSEADEIINLRELADCRQLVSVDKLTVQGTTECASKEKTKPGSLLAILVPRSPLIYGMARAYQMFSEHHRDEVRIFYDLDEALEWLADNDNQLDEFRKFVAENESKQ